VRNPFPVKSQVAQTWLYFFVHFYLLTGGRRCGIMAGRACPRGSVIFVNRHFAQNLHEKFVQHYHLYYPENFDILIIVKGKEKRKKLQKK